MREEARARVIEDSVTLTNMKVNSDGSINVSAVIAAIPETSTQVVEEAFSDVNSAAGVDTFYTITNAMTLTIQSLGAGAEEKVGGSAVELFFDPDADLGVNMVRIETLFVNGDSAETTVDQDFVGDGTARIVSRRRGYTASAREIFVRWRGFEE